MQWELAGAVILSGMIIVFMILTILILVVMQVGKLMNSQRTIQPQTDSRSVAAAPEPTVQSGVGAETVAVISAAVAAVMEAEAPGASYAVTSIRRQRAERPVWGFAGMQRNTRPF